MTLEWHHSVNIANISPAAISAAANNTADHSGVIILCAVCILILLFFAGLAND